MSVGLIALLDDIAALAKLAAASLDDVSAAAVKASAKAAGVVIDDAAVTPRYVTGLSPKRELPIIGRIALGSLRNKLLLLLPAGLLLSALLPWIMTPLLMIGGAYLCFEGAEKLLEKLLPHPPEQQVSATEAQDPAHIERTTISGAIRTDLILSAEIMAIALASVADEPLWERAVILFIVSLGITAGVYGVVAIIVKLDDIGLHLCREGSGIVKPLGGLMVRSMPHILAALTVVGTAAMLWVGGGIIVHGLETLGVGFPGHPIAQAAHAASAGAGGAAPVVEWLVHAVGAAIFGLALGAVLAVAWGAIGRFRSQKSG